MVVGVIGGGQLGRMLAQEAIPLGIDVRFLVTSPNDPAAQVGARHTVGSADSLDDLRRFADSVDVLTFEHEVVDFDVLDQLAADGHLLRPSVTSFAAVSHKARMRSSLSAAGIPTPPWRLTSDPDEAAQLVTDEGPKVLKLAHGGYDGRGTFFVDEPAKAVQILNASGETEVLMEPQLDLVAELAVIVVRDTAGRRVTYDPVSTIQVDGQCRRIDAPTTQTRHISDSARLLAEQASEAVDSHGVLAVELFLTDNGLVVNELAARPHNTGHHTLDAAVTSQFANHLRAISGLPLGDPSLLSPAVTANVIGVDADTEPRLRLAAGLAVDPAAHVHLYGKAPRRDRKLGHVTVCDDDLERARHRVARVVEALGGQEVPQ